LPVHNVLDGSQILKSLVENTPLGDAALG
jgi:hypothetical protein